MQKKRAGNCRMVLETICWYGSELQMVICNALPVLLYYIIFKYVPMYGITMAFKDYNVFKGVFESPWCGFDVFQKILIIKISGWWYGIH